jgi:hypothetical protein
MPGPGQNSDPTSIDPPPSVSLETRWQAVFQRSDESLFLLNGRRRILFVNRAWEERTGIDAIQARGLICTRRAPVAEDPWDLAIRWLCCPPPEVRKGEWARVRRALPGAAAAKRWWIVEFIPFKNGPELLAVLGKLALAPGGEAHPAPPLPLELVALREKLVDRFSLAQQVEQLPASRLLINQIRIAADLEAPITLYGERGTGKTFIARTIHGLSGHRSEPFVALDCSRLPGELVIETALASRLTRQTIYLKEPGALALNYQARMLGILAGGDTTGPRFLAGSSTTLAEEVTRGRLLPDLQVAFSNLVLHLPPLRERMADLPRLIEQLLPRAARACGVSSVELAPEALNILEKYSWPGNIRELYTVLRAACLRGEGTHITAQDLPAYLRLQVRLGEEQGRAPEKILSLEKILAETEKRLIIRALRKAKGNRSRAAELLSIWRPKLLRRMQALGIKEW